MEKNAIKSNNGAKKAMRIILFPLLAGIITLSLCLLLFPLVLLKTDDPALFIPASACITIALIAFFAGMTAVKVSKASFVVCAISCALVISLLLFGAAFALSDTSDLTFTVTSSILSLIFALIGARVAKGGKVKGKGKKRRR